MVRHIVGRLAYFFLSLDVPLLCPQLSFHVGFGCSLQAAWLATPLWRWLTVPIPCRGFPKLLLAPAFPTPSCTKSHETTLLLMGYYLLLAYVPLLRATWTLGGPPRLPRAWPLLPASGPLSSLAVALPCPSRAPAPLSLRCYRPWHCHSEQT